MIISTTLVGRGCADIVQPALESVSTWADACLLIDTGDDPVAMAAAVAAAGPKALCARFPWVNDYSAARNFALDEATRQGGTWAVTLDPDERLVLDSFDVRQVLSSTSSGCLLLTEKTGRYSKERFFRLPCPERFSGIVHEAFAGYRVGAETLERGWFEEIEKSSADLAAKSQREVDMLRTQVAMEPDHPRWRYYLGDSLERVGDLAAAIDAYAVCVGLRGWPEEAAWACYRAAHCEITRGNTAAALDWCALGLARYPGMPELAWTAALAEWQAGHARNAVTWARLAESLGDVVGCHASDGRIGFRHQPAAYEGPYDILRFALRALGDDEGAQAADADYLAARALRESRADDGRQALEHRELA